MTSTLRIIALSALATAAVIKGAPALAQEPAPKAVSIVTTADLDLSSASGQRTLDRRLAQAAVDVCGGASVADLSGRNAIRVCRDEALATARVQAAQALAKRPAPTTIEVALAR